MKVTTIFSIILLFLVTATCAFAMPVIIGNEADIESAELTIRSKTKDTFTVSDRVNMIKGNEGIEFNQGRFTHTISFDKPFTSRVISGQLVDLKDVRLNVFGDEYIVIDAQIIEGDVTLELIGGPLHGVLDDGKTVELGGHLFEGSDITTEYAEISIDGEKVTLLSRTMERLSDGTIIFTDEILPGCSEGCGGILNFIVGAREIILVDGENAAIDKAVSEDEISIRSISRTGDRDDLIQEEAVDSDMISVGGPCVNEVTADIMGLEFPACGTASGMKPGEVLVKKYSYGTYGAWVIAGWDAKDTLEAAHKFSEI